CLQFSEYRDEINALEKVEAGNRFYRRVIIERDKIKKWISAQEYLHNNEGPILKTEHLLEYKQKEIIFSVVVLYNEIYRGYLEQAEKLGLELNSENFYEEVLEES